MKQLALLITLVVLSSFTVNAQLKIYGGKNHDQFLGCLDCNTEDLNSVWSLYSPFGTLHNANSIWNSDGKYGSKTSNYSPFNEKAKWPPIILDKNGKSHGYFTINKKFPNRSSNGKADIICERRDDIITDIPGFYKTLYESKYKK